MALLAGHYFLDLPFVGLFSAFLIVLIDDLLLFLVELFLILCKAVVHESLVDEFLGFLDLLIISFFLLDLLFVLLDFLVILM